MSPPTLPRAVFSSGSLAPGLFCRRSRTITVSVTPSDAGARIPSRTHDCGNPFPPIAGKDSCTSRDEIGISSQPTRRPPLSTASSSIRWTARTTGTEVCRSRRSLWQCFRHKGRSRWAGWWQPWSAAWTRKRPSSPRAARGRSAGLKSYGPPARAGSRTPLFRASSATSRRRRRWAMYSPGPMRSAPMGVPLAPSRWWPAARSTRTSTLGPD